MDRLTRPEVMVVQTAARFMGSEVKIQDISNKLMHLILNGPTINSINKDTLRHLVRQLYEALQRYEELEMTPEDIEHQLRNFSSFLMEMTGGRMSKTNYTLQAMVSEANDYFERACDECSDRQELAAVKAERDALAVIVRNISACTHCKHLSNLTTQEPCKHCHEKDNYPYWEFCGAKDTNVPSKSATDTNVGSKEE